MAGRKNAFDTVIKPNLEKIKKWLAEGVTEKDIYKTLSLAPSTWCKAKKEHPEFAELVYGGRVKPIEEIESAVFKAACGFERVTRRAIKLKDTEFENGKKVRETERIEYYNDIEYFKPDTTAAIFLLTNWGKNFYARDAAQLELKKQELELKKADQW